MGKLRNEFEEEKRFTDFLERTGRIDKIDGYKRTSQCIHILEDFSAIAPESSGETLNHLSEVNRTHKEWREHALSCERCRLTLDAIFIFKGYENRSFFPEKIKKILEKEWKYDDEKGIYVIKLPAPTTGNFGSTNSRLVYATGTPIQAGIEEFKQRIKKPLGLEDLTEFAIREKRSKGKVHYFQADTHHKRPDQQTYISIRSKYKTR